MSKAELQDLFLNALASGADQTEDQRRTARLLANRDERATAVFPATPQTWSNVITANFDRQTQPR